MLVCITLFTSLPLKDLKDWISWWDFLIYFCSIRTNYVSRFCCCLRECQIGNNPSILFLFCPIFLNIDVSRLSSIICNMLNMVHNIWTEISVKALWFLFYFQNLGLCCINFWGFQDWNWMKVLTEIRTKST